MVVVQHGALLFSQHGISSSWPSIMLDNGNAGMNKMHKNFEVKLKKDGNSQIIWPLS